MAKSKSVLMLIGDYVEDYEVSAFFSPTSTSYSLSLIPAGNQQLQLCQCMPAQSYHFGIIARELYRNADGM